jgi:hypothetical protein
MRRLSDGERAILAQDGPEPEDRARVRVLSQRFVTARKRLACSLCPGGAILAGQRYERLTLLEDGDLAFLTLCLPGDCRKSQGRRA